MTATSFQIGQELTLTGTFHDNTDTLTDPTTVACKVRQPDGTIVTVTVTSTTVGVWQGTFLITQSGQHWYRFEGTGTIVTADEETFVVATEHV